MFLLMLKIVVKYFKEATSSLLHNKRYFDRPNSQIQYCVLIRNIENKYLLHNQAYVEQDIFFGGLMRLPASLFVFCVSYS